MVEDGDVVSQLEAFTEGELAREDETARRVEQERLYRQCGMHTRACECPDPKGYVEWARGQIALYQHCRCGEDKG